MFWMLYPPGSCNKCWYTGTPILPTVAQFCVRSLGVCHMVCRYACIPVYIYTYTYFLQHFLWVLLSIFVTFPFLLPSANPFVAYSTEGTCGYPVQLESLGGATLLAAVPPVFSPPLGVVPSLIIYKALSLLFLNSGIAHLQMTYIHATAGSSVSCCTTLLTRKSSTVWPYFTTLGAPGTNVSLPCSLDIHVRGRTTLGRGQLLRYRNCPSDRHNHRRACCWYWGAEVNRKSRECFLHFWLRVFFLSRTAC